MNRQITRHKQRGAVLWLLLAILTLAASYTFYQSANAQSSQRQHENQRANSLARAKDALIARAVTDDNRPGSLPCPDLITNSPGLSNLPGDGKADMFTLTQCPSYVGWLPWVTLDLPELIDDSGTRLWYVLAPTLRDDDSAQPINSDTPMSLLVDGSSEIAALIIAPGAPLAGQIRPSNRPADYLDGENGNGNDHNYLTGPRGDGFNDVVLVITRQELMAAVEKRVVNEISSCLNQHTHSAANADQRTPWPSPFSATAQQGKSGSYFGRIPLTQPGSGPQAALQASVARLGETTAIVAGSSDPNQQLLSLNQLSEQLVQARNLFDVIFASSNQIKQDADAISAQLLGLTTSIDSAILKDGVNGTEGGQIRTKAGSDDSKLDALTAQLGQLGFDPFTWQLTQLASALSTAGSDTVQRDRIQNIRDLLNASRTERPDFGPALATASSAAALACNAASGSTICITGSTTASISNVLTAINQLNGVIAASRINLTASEVGDYASTLAALNLSLSNTPGSANGTLLASTLSATKLAIDRISSSLDSIIAARNTASSELQAAIVTSQALAPNASVSTSITTAAIEQIRQLASVIAANEAIDQNLSHTSLSTAIAAFKAARTTFTKYDTQLPRPTKLSMVPYATTLETAAVDVQIWAKIISANALTIAPLAKANPLAAGVDLSKAVVLDSSAYKMASDALNSISGKKASAELMQTYIASPTADNRSKALIALAETTRLLNALATQAGALEVALSSTTASAFPTLWASSRCDFLRLGQKTWWNDNHWSNTLFYQITGALAASPGTLTINGTGNHALLTVSAGKALGGADRSNQSAANYFEQANADVSRDGTANAPSPGFISRPTSASFNDRLGH